MQPELMGISKNKKGQFLDFGRKMLSTEGNLKRLATHLRIFAAHNLGNTGLGVQKHFTKFYGVQAAKRLRNTALCDC